MTEKRKSRVAKRESKQPKRKLNLKKIMLFIVAFIVAIGIGITVLFASYVVTAPSLDESKLDMPFAAELLDQDGDVFASLYDENRKKIEYDDLPQVLIDAVTATEDVRFFEHPGIDVRRIGGAVIANIRRGFGAEGASTITQQVVENLFLTPEKKLKLKVQEQWLAIQLERKYSKEEILEMYLNKIFYGSNAYGVGKAAEVYFGVTDLHDLTLTQAAMLAGLPQRPSAYNPFENPDLMEGRVETVLKLMVRHGKITQAEADEARNVSIESQLTDKKPLSLPYDAFIQQVKEEVEKKLDGADVYTDGLKIYTTLDRKAQDYVEFLLTDSDENPINYPDEELQAGVAILDTNNGAIRAIGGGRNRDSGDLNYATKLDRQAGSTFKPLLAYGPAIEHSQWSTYEQLLDEPYTPPGSDKPIANANQSHGGWMTMRQALTHSNNVTAAKTLEELGSDVVKPFGEKLGLQFKDGKLDPRDAIGGTHNGTSPLRLANAYQPFGNEGIYVEAHAVTKVEFPDGNVVELTPEADTVMHDYTAYMVTDMLKDVLTSGTGKRAHIDNLPAAGKTGTTNNNTNSWFVGYTTNYTISAWTGYNEDKRSVTDTSISQQLYRNMMMKLSEGMETADFVRPSSVVDVAIEKGTNPPALPSDYTPKEQIITELFVKGTEPTNVSEEFDQLDPVENLQSEYNEDANSIKVSWQYDNDEDIEFQIRYKENDGSLKELTQTTDKEVVLEDVKVDTTYTFEVIVVHTETDAKSNAATTSVHTPKEAEVNLPNVTRLQASFDETQSLINVTWDYNGPPVQFEINVNGQIEVIESRQFTIPNVQDDTTYSITVTPIDDDNRGDGSNTKITVKYNNDGNNNDNSNNNDGDDNGNNNDSSNENGNETNTNE